MNKLRNTNKQGEKLLLGGMAAISLSLINGKTKTVKASAIPNNGSVLKKASKTRLKTKINYQTARSKLVKKAAAFEASDEQDAAEVATDKPTQAQAAETDTTTTDPADDQVSENNQIGSATGNKTQTTEKSDKTDIPVKFDPAQANRSSLQSKWNGLDVTFNSDNNELTIQGGTDTPAIIDNSATPDKLIGISRNIEGVSANYINIITIKGKINLVGSITGLFGDLHNLRTINGLENIDTQGVTSIEKMFSNDYHLSSLDLSSFDTSNVTDMNSMFYGCSALKNLKFDPTKFNTAKVTNMASMFKSCGVQSIDLSRFNTSNVTNMADMFYGCAVTSLDLSHFDTTKVTDMSGMFNYNVLQALDVSCLDTAKVTNMAKMFANGQNLASINFGTKDATKFNTSNVTDMSDMFNTSEKLTDIDLSTFNTAKVTNMADMFFSCKALTGLDLSPLDTFNVTDMNGMFQYCNGLTSLDVSPLDTAKVTNMARMFSYCQKLTSLDVSTFKTSNVTSMEDMFDYCSSLTDLKFGDPGTTTFDTSNVVTMKNMFAYCSAMVNLDLSAFDTSKVEVFTYMFNNCSHLANLNLSSFKISAKTSVSGGISMDYMFQDCTSLATIDVSHFDTSNVGNMMGMFRDCFSLASLDLTNFDTSNVSDMSDMFNQCISLKRLNLSSFDTSNVTNMYFMFANSGLERLDISNFDMSNVSNTFNMLGGLKNLKILVLGKKNKIGTSPFNDELNSKFNTSGTWTNMGSGQVPKDQNSWTADQLVNKYDTSKDYDTYVNFSAPSLITVKYVDNNQKDIVPSDQLYDFKNTALLDTLPTFNSRKLNRNTDYQLEHIELDGKTVSDLKNVKFGDTPHTITFVYNAIPAGVITVYYKYKDKEDKLHDILENGKPKTAAINGSLHDRSAKIQFHALEDYTKQSYQINGEDPVINTDDFTVPLTKDPQTVTLIYNPISAGTITVNYKYKGKDGQLHDILDENGKQKTTTINGYLFEHSANIKFDALDGYTKQSYQINGEDPVINTDDFTVPLTKDSQTITLIYSHTSGNNSSNGSSDNNGSNGSSGNDSNGSNDSSGNDSNGSNGSSGNGSNGSNGSSGNDSNDSNGSSGNNSNGSNGSSGNNSNGSNGSNSNGNGSSDNGSGNNNSNNSGSDNNNSGSGINNGSSNNSGSNSNSSGNNSSSSSNNNGATGSIGNNSDNNLNNGSNNTGSNVSSGKHKNTSKKLNKHRNKPSSNNKGFTKPKNKYNKYNNGKTKNMEKAGSSNIATHKEKLLPQTGSNKRSNLAVLALGGLALASALSAIWFNHKED